MQSQTLAEPAMKTIGDYLHFKIGSASVSVPYFNNKTTRTRAALRTFIGKGNPSDIRAELEVISVNGHVDENTLDSESLKKMLVDNNLGIECSGFTYHVLEAESIARGFGRLKKHLSFCGNRGLIGKIRSNLRPVENCNVATFADDSNSKIIPLTDVRPGDIITMTASNDNDDFRTIGGSTERNHILVIHEVVYEIKDGRSTPSKIFYSHAVAYPEDGIYGTGVRQGEIEISDTHKPITEAKWTEEGKIGKTSISSSTNRLFLRAQKSLTEIRRLNWF